MLSTLSDIPEFSVKHCWCQKDWKPADGWAACDLGYRLWNVIQDLPEAGHQGDTKLGEDQVDCHSEGQAHQLTIEWQVMIHAGRGTQEGA